MTRLIYALRYVKFFLGGFIHECDLMPCTTQYYISTSVMNLLHVQLIVLLQIMAAVEADNKKGQFADTNAKEY